MNKTIEQLAEEIYPKGNVHFVSGHMVDLNKYLKDAFIAGAQSLQSENERLREALVQAVQVIKDWHSADQVWQIYYDKAPEMKLIREALQP